ncbi:pentatricopeptide repeat-containing protein At2g29760, chloroplastic-like [Nicotiana sylvestris]|uniref:pentatricopeptide repeat-containing protein At2g29760, chloroplastic-like n=1 Tax=Nicotiana sylvestris TaxID=4096 RepID=UPI00388CAD22
MREYGLKKEPGCSSNEVNVIVLEFLVGDKTHPLSQKIYAKLDEIPARLKSVGYVSNKSQRMQLIEEEEEDMKEKALNLHSERLAMTFGLIGGTPSQPICIVKNLRVCWDCRSIAKILSKLYD